METVFGILNPLETKGFDIGPRFEFPQEDIEYVKSEVYTRGDVGDIAGVLFSMIRCLNYYGFGVGIIRPLDFQTQQLYQIGKQGLFRAIHNKKQDLVHPEREGKIYRLDQDIDGVCAVIAEGNLLIYVQYLSGHEVLVYSGEHSKTSVSFCSDPAATTTFIRPENSAFISFQRVQGNTLKSSDINVGKSRLEFGYTPLVAENTFYPYKLLFTLQEQSQQRTRQPFYGLCQIV